MAPEQLDPVAIFEEHRKSRGDAFWEMERLVHMFPEEASVIADRAGYVHGYEGHGDTRQQLSVQMRELIALVLLASKGEHRFAPNHVRRLYRLGITNSVMIEAFLAGAPVTGWANVLHGMRAIQKANDPDNKEGVLPPGGEPKTLVDFPELHLGEEHPEAKAEDAGLGATPEWQYIAEIDPGLAERVVGMYNLFCLDGGVERSHAQLPPAARELVTITALCARGLVDLAADHIRRALRYGVNELQILEAISSALPMTGLTTVTIGARAMMQAGINRKANP